MSTRCQYRFRRGAKRGQLCHTHTRNGHFHCTAHRRFEPQASNDSNNNHPLWGQHNGTPISQPSQPVDYVLQPAVSVSITSENMNIFDELNQLISNATPNSFEEMLQEILTIYPSAHIIRHSADYPSSNFPSSLFQTDNVLTSTVNLDMLDAYRFADKAATCSVCLDDIFTDKNDTLQGDATVLQCNHAFHIKCISDYFSQTNKSDCPNCRAPHSNLKACKTMQRSDVSGGNINDLVRMHGKESLLQQILEM